MPKSRKPIIREIQTYIDGVEGMYGDWFVGVADSAREALFDRHGVLEEGDLWIYRTATTSRVAHAVRDFFTAELGADGSNEARDGEPTMVYAYRKSEHTDP